MNVVFLGPPGSGKGTHARRVSASKGVPHISTGEMLREHIKQQTPLGKEAKVYMDLGRLVPDELVIDMLKDKLKESQYDNGVILDGFPRTVRQAEELDEITTVDHVINLDISDADIVARMAGRRTCPVCGYTSQLEWLNGDMHCRKCGAIMVQRDDDKEVTVLERLRVYHIQTQPLIDYYTKRGVLRTVNTLGEVDEVAQRVSEALAE